MSEKAHAGFNYVLSSDSKHIIGLNEKRFILQDNWMKFKVWTITFKKDDNYGYTSIFEHDIQLSSEKSEKNVLSPLILRADCHGNLQSLVNI